MLTAYPTALSYLESVSSIYIFLWTLNHDQKLLCKTLQEPRMKNNIWCPPLSCTLVLVCILALRAFCISIRVKRIEILKAAY